MTEVCLTELLEQEEIKDFKMIAMENMRYTRLKVKHNPTNDHYLEGAREAYQNTFHAITNYEYMKNGN